MFRIRNVLVRVDYESTDHDGRRESLTGGYEAAVAAARAIHA